METTEKAYQITYALEKYLYGKTFIEIITFLHDIGLKDKDFTEFIPYKYNSDTEATIKIDSYKEGYHISIHFNKEGFADLVCIYNIYDLYTKEE